MRKAPLAALTALLLAALAGCGHPRPPATPAKPPTPPSVATTPTPQAASASPVSVAALAAQVKRAVVPANGLATLGAGGPVEDGPGKWAVTTDCNRSLPTDPDMLAGYRRTWKTARGIVQSFAFGYDQQTSGASVLDGVRALNGACTSYRLSDENATRFVLGAYPASRPAGVTGFYAYCERVSTTYLCYGFISHDNLVGVVVSAGQNLTAVHADLNRVLAIAAASLRTA